MPSKAPHENDGDGDAHGEGATEAETLAQARGERRAQAGPQLLRQNTHLAAVAEGVESVRQTVPAWVLAAVAFASSLVGYQTAKMVDAVVEVTARGLYEAGFIASPLQLSSFTSTLCELGAGVLVTIILWAAAMMLLAGAAGDTYRGFKEQNSKKRGSNQNQSSSFVSAGIQAFGAVIMGGLPSLLASAGFNLISCVNAINIFGSSSNSGNSGGDGGAAPAMSPPDATVMLPLDIMEYASIAVDYIGVTVIGTLV